MPKLTAEELATRAFKVAEGYYLNVWQVAGDADYDDEYDEGSELSEILRQRLCPVEMANDPFHYRYLVIGVEMSGDAQNSGFYSTLRDARKRMGEFARDGWSSFLWDLTTDGVAKERRAPR